MITEKEITEYRILCATLGDLRKKYNKRKNELCLLLAETIALRRNALLILTKANRLTRRLTAYQRQLAGITYHLEEIKARTNQMKVEQKGVERMNIELNIEQMGAEQTGTGQIRTNGKIKKSQAFFQNTDSIGEKEGSLEIREKSIGLREFKAKGAMILGMIDNVRKNILQLDLLELRCRELILSTKKALEAFRYEYKNIHRKIYPYGMFSILSRFLRYLWNRTYFTIRDIKELSALANITGYVLKIADTPIS